MIKNFLFFPLCLLVCALSVGCGVLELNVENILTPPKISELQAEISAVLTRSIGSSYTLKYPKGGKYYSGYNFIDLNNDQKDELIVFLNVDSTAYVQMAVLYENELGWHLSELISDFGYANDVDFINFGELGGINTLMIGMRASENTSTSVLAIYDIANDEAGKVRLEQNNKWDYSSLIIEDYNNDGKTDIIIFDIADSFKGTPATITVVELDESRMFSVKQFFNLYHPVSEYLNVGIVNIAENMKAISVDARLSTSYYTTAIYPIINGALSELEHPKQELLRTLPVTVTDIDNDGIAEIPIQVLAKGYENSAQAAEYFVEYKHVYTTESKLMIAPQIIKKHYISFNRGILFELPQRWLKLPISVYSYPQKGELLFFINSDGNVFDHSNELFRIVISQDNTAPTSKHIVLRERGSTKYLGLIPQLEEPYLEYNISAEECINLFKLL